jgi:Mrp family chromosome partitioning ATPase
MLARLDKRLRSLASVESTFNLEILTALPSVRSPTRRPNGERAPARPLLEPLRRLATTLQMGQLAANGGRGGPRSILFLAADAGDGESTLIANLARVRRDGGERVAVVDANLRRPAQARLLDVPAERGLSDVLNDTVQLRPTLQPADSGRPAAPSAAPAGDGVATVVESAPAGSLSVLTSGSPAPNPPALLGSPAMGELLRSLTEENDCVLIDAPPPVEVTDCMPLLGQVDAIIVVVRMGHTREPSAQRLAQTLARTASAPVIGVVANCVPRKDIERYGYAYAPVPAGKGLKILGR